MASTDKGLLIDCDLEGIIRKVHYENLNIPLEGIEGTLFINLFSKSFIANALELIIEIKKRSASFGWEFTLKPELSTENFYFGGALLNNGITFFGSPTKVNFANFLAGITQINNEQINKIRELEKENVSSQNHNSTSSYLFDELSRLNNELVGMQRELTKKIAS